MVLLRLLAMLLLSVGSGPVKNAGAALYLQRGMPEAEVCRVLGKSAGGAASPLAGYAGYSLDYPQYGLRVWIDTESHRVASAGVLSLEQVPGGIYHQQGACFLRPRPNQENLEDPGVPASGAFSPDGKVLASSGWDHTVKLWDVARGKKTATLPADAYPLPLAFSPDGKVLASAGWDSTLILWDVASGRNTAILSGHTKPILSIAFSPDGKTLASGSDDTTIRMWDVASGRTTVTLQGKTCPFSLAFSPDGKTLASGSLDKTVKLWDVASRRNTATFRGHTNYVKTVAFSPNGKTLASGSSDMAIKLWEVASGMPSALK